MPALAPIPRPPSDIACTLLVGEETDEAVVREKTDGAVVVDCVVAEEGVAEGGVVVGIEEVVGGLVVWGDVVVGGVVGSGDVVTSGVEVTGDGGELDWVTGEEDCTTAAPEIVNWEE